MKAFRLTTLLVFGTILCVGLLLSGVIRDLPTAYSNGSDIIVTWRTVDETGVERFEVLRRAGIEGDFMQIGSPLGPQGDNTIYQFVDQQVFKGTGNIYQYKVRIVMTSNDVSETPPITVSHISSTASRTWGSIKAMFR